LFSKSPEELKAEVSVKKYLDSLNKSSKCEIISFDDLHPKYTTYEDDTNYDKYQKQPLKLDSIKKNFKPALIAWSIFVTYKGKDDYGSYGKHRYLCALNKDLSKCIVGIQIDNVYIKH